MLTSKTFFAILSLDLFKLYWNNLCVILVKGHPNFIRLCTGYPCIPADNNRIIDIGSFKTHYMSNLFIIALAHAFKHARPPIKDINDCYLLVEKQLIDYDYITEFVKKNKMEIKYYALCKILIEYYDVHSTMLKNFQKIQEILSLKDKVIVSNVISSLSISRSK